MMSIPRIALLFLFCANCAKVQEPQLPAPYKKTLYDISFCTSKALIIELLKDSRKSKASVGTKEGCGNLFIPFEYTVTPIHLVRLKSNNLIIDRLIIAEITNKFGEIAFIVMRPPKEFSEFSFGGGATKN